ncbi:sugar ABC transporter substrate-binding protein [Pseudonocardia benzenivorans]
MTENVAKYKALPTFTPPGPPIDPTTLHGKRMYLIPLVPNPFNQSIQETMQAIAQKIGMEFTIYPNQGKPSEWVQGMNAALTAKPDIIVLSTAPDPRTLQPQLAAAKAAGIPVLVTHFYDDSSPVPPACEGCAAGVTALVTARSTSRARRPRTGSSPTPRPTPTSCSSAAPTCSRARRHSTPSARSSPRSARPAR